MSTPLPAVAASPVQPRLGSVIAAACLLLAIALPVISLCVAMYDPAVMIEGLKLPQPQAVSAEDLTLFQRIGLAVLSVIPPLFQSYGLLCARRCFQSFVRGEYFARQIVKALRGFAAGMFFAIVAGFVTTPLLSMLLTLHAGPGQHALMINFGSEELLRLLFAGILWQMAAVMLNAVKLAEENSQFV